LIGTSAPDTIVGTNDNDILDQEEMIELLMGLEVITYLLESETVLLVRLERTGERYYALVRCGL